MILHLRKRPDHTFEVDPAFADDLITAQSIPVGELVSFEGKKKRNPAFHRKFFALMNVVFENQHRVPTLDLLINDIKVRVGHCDEYVVDGRIVSIPRSISFASMDDVEFTRFYNAALQAVMLNYFEGLEEHEIEREVDKRLGFA